MPEPHSLHVIERDLDDPLRAKRLPLESFVATPSALDAGNALIVFRPRLPRMPGERILS
jgi:hypothetical protein